MRGNPWEEQGGDGRSDTLRPGQKRESSRPEEVGARLETTGDFADELPPRLRDLARRGLAWLDADGLRVHKLNSIGAVWLARFFPPGIRGSYLPDPLRQVLRAWQQGRVYSGAFGSWSAASTGDRLIVRAFPDHERRSLLLTLDLLTSFDNRLARNGFTPREVEVLSWVTRGKTDPEIALILGASPRTIEKHVQRILAKLGVENRTAAALAGIEAGF